MLCSSSWGFGGGFGVLRIVWRVCWQSLVIALWVWRSVVSSRRMSPSWVAWWVSSSWVMRGSLFFRFGVGFRVFRSFMISERVVVSSG